MRKKGIKAMGNNGIELERDGFKSRTGFILACIGSAVGMGNIWRFPYMVSAWGGMTFLIPYVLFVILIGSTGVIEEMALGRATKGGPIKAFGDCMQMRTGKRKAGEAIGFIPVLGSLALTAAILGYGFVAFGFQTVYMVGPSMEPTLTDGESYLVNKAVYLVTSPERYDVVAYRIVENQDKYS